MHKDGGPFLGLAGQSARDVGAEKGVETFRRVGEEQLLALLQPLAQSVELASKEAREEAFSLADRLAAEVDRVLAAAQARLGN